MAPWKLALYLLVVVCFAAGMAWVLWRSQVSDREEVGTNPVVGDLTITEIPRPNSGTYTTEEATTRLPKTMARSRAIDPKSALVAGWKNPTHGFRVHVTAKNHIVTVNCFGEKQAGMGGLKAALALSESMQYGNPLSVLLTSDTNGWYTDKQQQILEMLFQPSIQLYIVTDKEDQEEGEDRPSRPDGS